MPPARRVPLLYGSRLVVAGAGEDAIVVAPPPPPEEPIADVGAAIRDALRFPLVGEPLESLVSARGRATIVVEPPALPIPVSSRDPRQAALVAAADELERIGIPTARQTILVAGGLGRRPGRRTLESLVVPEFALRFHGELEVHDAEAPDLVEVGAHDGIPLRVNRALVETDAIVVVTAAPDGAARRPRCAACRHGGGDPARRRRRVAARDAPRAWLGARARPRARDRRARPADRRLADPRPAASFGHAARVSLRPRRRRANRRLPPGAGVQLPPGAAAGPHSLVAAIRADRLGRVRRPAVGRPRRGARPQRGHRVGGARRAARRDLPGDPTNDCGPPARAAERARVRDARARPRPAPLARRLPGARGRDRDPRQPAATPLRAPDADALPRLLPGDAHRPRPGRARRGRTGGRQLRTPGAIDAYRGGRTCHPRGCPLPTGPTS